MNSLSNLNTYSSLPITYEDGRVSQILYTNATPVNASISVNEGANSLAYLGTDIARIINPTNNVYYWIYFPTNPNLTITWPTMPDGVTLTNVTSTTFRVGPLQSLRQWTVVKQPTISAARDYAPHVYTYNSAIQVSNVNNATWSTTVTIVDTPEISDAGDFIYLTNGSRVVTQPALVVDTDANASAVYNIQLTSWSNLFPIPGTLSSAGTLGGNTAYAGNVLTISGNIDQTNELLSNITYTTTSSMYSDFLAVYTLTNPGTGIISTAYQNFYSDTVQFLSRTTAQESYYEDTNVTLANVPRFIDSANGLGTYSMTITAVGQSANATSDFTTVGSGTVTKSLAANTQQVVFSGTRSNLNSHLGNLTIVPYPDYDDAFLLKFEGNTMLGNIAARTKLMINAGTNLDAGDLGVDRLMYRNTPGLLFPTNPVQITDVPSGTDSYTVTLSSTAGAFRTNPNVYVASRTFSGNKASINSQLANIQYYPNKGFVGYTLVNYKQTYVPTSNLQVDSNISLAIVANVGNIPEQITYRFLQNVAGTNTYTVTPTEFQSRYLKCNITISGNTGFATGSFDNFILPYDSYTVAINFAETSGSGRRYNLVYANNLLGGYNGNKGGNNNRIPTTPVYLANKSSIIYEEIDKIYFNRPQPTFPTITQRAFVMAAASNWRTDVGAVGNINLMGLGQNNAYIGGPYSNQVLPWYVVNLEYIGLTGPANATIAGNTTWANTYNQTSTGSNVTIRFYDED